MEIKTHYKGRRCRKGGTKIKTKQRPQKRKYENQDKTTAKKKRKKKDEKLERQNSEVVRFEFAPPEKDTKHSPNRLSKITKYINTTYCSVETPRITES